jgi:hypothetical protein
MEDLTGDAWRKADRQRRACALFHRQNTQHREVIMPSSNIEIVRGLYDAFLRGDLDTVMEGVSPDATWVFVGRQEDVPFAGTRHGKAGAADYFRVLSETVEVNAFEPRELVASEDKVFARGDWQWTVRRNGVGGSNEWLHIFTLGDGKVTTWRCYTDTAHLAETWHASEAAKRAAS